MKQFRTEEEYAGGMKTGEDSFLRPFPALTPAQRYHLDVYGYVVVENALTAGETGRLLEAMYRLKRDFLGAEDPLGAEVRGCRLATYVPHNMQFNPVLATDPAVLDYVTHPRLVGMVEELVGDTVRLEESGGAINSRDPDEDLDKPPGFHAGVRPDVGSYVENGLFHCTFVKTLTNLTDLGPDDGGTVVIAGSHKMKCPQEEIIACATEDPSLVHQVEAPAGSTLLFGESLIHATGQRRSDGERVIIVAGYTPTHFQAWPGQEPSAEFVQGLPERLKPFISGSASWHREFRFRKLADAAEPWPRQAAR